MWPHDRGRGVSTDLVIPTSREAVLVLESPVLYLLEQAGGVAREILDGRIVDWTEQGWTQQRIADEIGCSRRAIGKRQERLGVQPTSNRGHPRELEPGSNSGDNGEIVDAEVIDADEPANTDAPDRTNGQAHEIDDAGSVRCPTCGHMCRADDIRVWTE